MLEVESVLTQVCLIHRYDEWVKADRIIWPVEKGTKKRQRKKVKVSSGRSCDLLKATSDDAEAGFRCWTEVL